MRVRMLIGITGTRNGVAWPKIGDILDVDPIEAADLISSGIAAADETVPEPAAPKPRKKASA